MSTMLRLLVFPLLFAAAAVAAQDYVPTDLEDWRQWVLKDREYRECPHFFDRAARDRGDFVCTWPGELTLVVEGQGARFSQRWTIYAKAQWVALPGSAEHWPDRVLVNDREAEVVARDDVPGLRLAPGSWQVAGRFQWEQRPGVLRLPSESGLVTLTVDGRRIDRPEFNGDGIFLGERKVDTRAVDSVFAEVYRLVADDVPTRLVTQLEIDVAGGVREEVFGPILPDGFVPLNIRSQLPARLEGDGNLRVQVRPGRWTIWLTARGPGVLDELVRPPTGTNLPATEIWSYQTNELLRVTAAEGLPPVDPAQVKVPGNWSTLPAFRVDPGAALTIVERSRGVTAASNELQLDRTIWLDFAGDGFVVRDAVSGRMRTGWRLDMSPPYALLSATELGENLLITQGPGEGETGVEVRQTEVDVDALGRSETRGAMPVTGWAARFAAVGALLHLPPGHKLLAAPGVDEAAGSWFSQWQLLDFFLVLIITIAVLRLLGRTAAAVALLALVLSFHEPFAPSWLWLNVLIAIALMRVAPEGRLRQLVSGYQLLSVVALVVALVPFIAGQLRVALYPQLEPQYPQYELYDRSVPPTAVTAEPEPGRAKSVQALRLETLEADSVAGDIVAMGSAAMRDFARYAPTAIVQAGPGIPSWTWNSYRLRWSGPVDAGQTMRLVILPRWVVSALRVAEVMLILSFAAALAAEILGKRWSLPGGLVLGRGKAVAILAAGTLLATMAASPPASADIPSAELLQQLEQRLLEPPDCAPRCAEIVAAQVDVGLESISMNLSLHALEDVAIPLPGSPRGWRPEAVQLDGSGNQRVLRSADGRLWLQVTAGRRSLVLRGPVPAVDSLEVQFPAPPRVIEVDSDGWFVAGIKDRRLLSGSLQLTRLQTDAGEGTTARWESSRFPAFARIERTIELDLDWRVRTTVYRVAPLEGAITLDVPLLEGESIVSGDFTVAEGRVLVSMDSQQRAVSWTSNLKRQSPLTLAMQTGSSWSEVWQFAVGNIWNATFTGVPESDTGDDVSDVRIAVFHPRGGEALRMAASRPEASAGSTLAFDSVHLSVTHGNRSSDTSLVLRYRSTRGAQHVLQLPADAELTRVAIDDRTQTLRAEDGELTVPILPGEHIIQVDWRATGDMGWRTLTPAVDIGAPASNIDLALTKPRDRWLLGTLGPELGPAVLYWSELTVLVLFALILGRVGLAPLNAWHWLLLGIGFSTFSWPALGVVILWLLACGIRERWQPDVNWWRFNLIQLGVGGLTVVALLTIVSTLPMGLLGTPDMQVTGHNSFGNELGWFADRSESVLPVATVITLPLWIYKVLILAWALWLSFALLRWLPWVWECFSNKGLWRSRKGDAVWAPQQEQPK